MYSNFNFDKILDYKMIKKTIKTLKNKYNSELLSLYKYENVLAKEYNFNNQRKFINDHKCLLLNMINDTLKIYEEELSNLRRLLKKFTNIIVNDYSSLQQ